MKKFLTAVLSLTMFHSQVFIPIYAEKEQHEKEVSKETVLDFNEFQYVSEHIAEDSVISYSFDGETETYTIMDPHTNEVTDIISVTTPMYSTNSDSNVHTAFLTADKIISGKGETVVKLRFTASVEKYSSGSFRSINALNYTTVGIVASMTDMEFKSKESHARPKTGGYPTTELSWSYTVNVATSGTVSVALAPYFVSAGFSKTNYFYKIINDAGTFRLY